ncbi:MAG: DUF2156 domain-containing protein [Clostridia bacterium]|nr:DUF2156 domain-containing protein [Clostridia bacterium]
MLDFRKLELSDQAAITPYLNADGVIMSDRTFASLYIWREVYGVQICFKDDLLYFLSDDVSGLRTYYMPLCLGGCCDLPRAMAEIEADAEAHGQPWQVVLVTTGGMEVIEAAYPGKYEFIADRDGYDYIYDAEALRTLRGKKYQAKRNYVNRFKNLYEDRWEYRPIDPVADREMLLAYTIEWGRARSGDGYQEDYDHELGAINTALTHYEELHMCGGILFVDGKIAAYTLGSVYAEGIMDVLFEKADVSIDGAYPMINNQFAIHEFEGFKLINREEDLGIEGLRTAKLSYNPVQLTEKYILLPRR